MMKVQISLHMPFSDKAPPDTDATGPLSTPKLARQAEDLQAHLSVFPNGY